MQNIKIKLDHAITFGSETISELSLARPKAKHFKGIKNPNEPTFDEMLLLISRLSALPTSQVDEIDVKDLEKVMEKLEGFLA